MEKPDDDQKLIDNPLVDRVSITKWKPDDRIFVDLDAWLGRQGERHAGGLDIPSK